MGPIDTPDIIGVSHDPYVVYPQSRDWTIYGRDGHDIYALHRLVPVPSFIKFRFPSLPARGGQEGYQFNGPGGFIASETLSEERLLYDEILNILDQVDVPLKTLLQFRDLPWVSSIVEIMPTGPKSMKYKMNFLQSHSFENSLISYSALCNSWGVPDPSPLIAPSEKLRCLAYLNESVAIVSLENETGCYIFKTNANPQLLYQEIEAIVRLDSHPNIIRKRMLVSKNTMISSMHKLDTASKYFERENMPIVGFLVEYCPGGTLMSTLTLAGGEVTLSDKAKWCTGLVSAMNHIRRTKQRDGRWGFYADLKPDNIVFSKSRDLILIDFETNGSWAQYTPPEILSWRPGAIYTDPTQPKLVFIRGPNPGEACMICSPHPCPFPAGCRGLNVFETHMDIFEYKRSIANILARKNSNSVTLSRKPIPFWGSASDKEREQAMVYMMGCIFWCIIEKKKCISECQDRRVTINSTDIPPQVKKTVESCFLPPGQRPRLDDLEPVFRAWEAEVLCGETMASEGSLPLEEGQELDEFILA